MPLISSMAIEMNILVNIVSAAYGSMLLGVPGGAEQAKMVSEYLGSVENVTVEEV